MVGVGAVEEFLVQGRVHAHVFGPGETGCHDRIWMTVLRMGGSFEKGL